MPLFQRFATAPKTSLHHWRWPSLIGLGALMSLYMAASAVASLGDELFAQVQTDGRALSVELALPDLDAQIARIEARGDQFIGEERIRSGDSIGSLLQRLNVSDPDAVAFIRSHDVARKMLQLRPGKAIQAQTDDMGQLRWLQFPSPGGPADTMTDVLPMTRIERTARGFSVRTINATIERRTELHAGVIRTSLFAATDGAGVPDGITRQIAEIFSSEIDFHMDLRRGDAFRVVYETLYANGEYLRAGRVLAAEFVNDGKTYNAIWFAAHDSGGGYYDLQGRSLRKAFLRSPIEFSRVSSGFSDNRLHPIQMRWKKHTGVDYAAPSGTPIRTVSDGVVEFSGWQNGYGNVVIVKHAGQYRTLYAHMSKFASGVKRGVRVSQGQIIGHVGATGWATGPHLHYEFHIAGTPQDPLKVVLPEAPPLDRQRLADFRTHSADLDRQLALLRVMPVALRAAR